MNIVDSDLAEQAPACVEPVELLEAECNAHGFYPPPSFWTDLADASAAACEGGGMRLTRTAA